MRVVIDTNVLISALLKANSTPAKVISLWRDGDIDLVVSSEIIKEIARVLGYSRIRKRVSSDEAKRFLALLNTAATVVEPQETVAAVSGDPDDDKFIALALASGAEYIVSGDDHLLSLSDYQGVAILNPARFLETFLRPRSAGGIRAADN